MTKERRSVPRQSDLIDILEIQQLKVRYARFGDTKNWTELRQCLTDDFHCLVDGAPRALVAAPDRYEVHSADDFLANAVRMVAEVQPIHHLTLPEIAITGDGTATGIWAIQDYLIAPHCIFRGWGHYHDHYLKRDGRWRIRESVLTRIRVEETWL
ncbi:nuclear transport factor 2 family protein [Novosphingobium sp. YAF33]|uniref:nuclear transport factor 2 family protein n=1 Tax=Novosphingobium sp. YAF33 TaxID=3233082 RepID=UPI003F94D0CD